MPRASLGCRLNVWVGYFNTSDPNNNRMGWRVLTPATLPSATNPLRGRARINGGGNATGAIGMNQGQVYSFEAWWQPTGGGLGTFSGNIAGTSWNLPGYSAGAATYDAFGLFWDESAATTDLSYYVYFDNMEYLVSVVPEPSSGLLAVLGVVGLWLGKRVSGHASCNRRPEPAKKS